MKKFVHIIEKYQQLGVRPDNIEYAIESAKHGAKREHVLENLLADYRGMKESDAMGLLNEVFAANGGEFKKENRGGYIYGTVMVMMGLACVFYIYYVYTYGGTLPVWVILGAIFSNLVGVVLIIKALCGRYRDADNPFMD